MHHDVTQGQTDFWPNIFANSFYNKNIFKTLKNKNDNHKIR